MTTRDQILAVVRAAPPTPMGLVRALEQDYPDTRSTLLRLIADGTVNFDVDGKLRVQTVSPADEHTSAPHHA